MNNDELLEMVANVTEMTARRIAEKFGQVKEIITLAEIKRLYGREIARVASSEASGIKWYLTNKKGEKHCKRAEFDRFLFKTDRYNIL